MDHPEYDPGATSPPPQSGEPTQPEGQPPKPPAGPAGYGPTPGPPTGARSKKGPIAAAVVLVVLVAGGGTFALLSGGDGGTEAVSSFDELRGATVQIVSQGSFVDPDLGQQLNAAGVGSGFIVDPSGIIVTNNHVVTGAATLEVLVGGEGEPQSAKVLGVSECSDLAVIDIEGDGYPFLEWYEGDIEPGLEVFAGGFPLGDPEFTLTKGIVSKGRASGETAWASVESVIEHDATINPGNSGGPLVTADGQVVGINYAGDSETGQFFAIAPPTATEVTDQLQAGEDIESLGMNAQAVLDEEGGLSGVWVAAVESGSPAAELGLQGGDLLTKLEGLALADDGSMADYCDILRTKGGGTELSAQVIRSADDGAAVLQGSFNSGEELETAPSFGDQTGSEVPTGGGPTSYSEYTYVQDDSGTLELEIPVEWSQVDGSGIDNGDGTTSPGIVASPDLEGFRQNFTTSGVVVGVVAGADPADPDGTLDQLLEAIGVPTACPESLGREDYDDGLYTGRSEVLTGCDGTSASFAAIVASPEGGEFTIFVGVQLATDADTEALDRIIRSFKVAQ